VPRSRPLRQLRAALTRRGTLAIVGGETGGRWLGGFDRSLRAPVLSRFVRQRLAAVMSSENAADLLVLAQLIEAGQVTPVIDRTYPLSQAPDAIRYMQQGHARGKVVITV
jgi:NADPH:quinone reductase-like Zn-dependent oxidoreductase